MFGMCRDKYGAAVVAGIFKALEILKPKHVKVHHSYNNFESRQMMEKYLEITTDIPVVFVD